MIKSIFVGLFRAARYLAVGFYYNWGLIYARWGQTNRAMWYFNHAIGVHPTNAKALYQRGLLYVAIGSPEGAVLDFSKAIENHPGYMEAYMNRGMMYTLLGFHAAASGDFDEAASLGADRASLERQAAQLAARTGVLRGPSAPTGGAPVADPRKDPADGDP